MAQPSVLESYRQHILRNAHNIHYFRERMRIPRKFTGVRLDEFATGEFERPGSQELRTNIRAAFDGLMNERIGGSIFITGACGSGKSHLAVTLCYEFLIRTLQFEIGEFDGQPGVKNVGGKIYPLFISTIEILMDLQQCYTERTSEERLIRNYTNFPLLVLDDLGAEQETEWARSRFYLIINRIYGEGRKMIVTSNLSLDQIAERLDDRIASRLSEYYVIDMGQEVMRLKVKRW